MTAQRPPDTPHPAGKGPDEITLGERVTALEHAVTKVRSEINEAHLAAAFANVDTVFARAALSSARRFVVDCQECLHRMLDHPSPHPEHERDLIEFALGRLDRALETIDLETG